MSSSAFSDTSVTWFKDILCFGRDYCVHSEKDKVVIRKKEEVIKNCLMISLLFSGTSI